MDFGIDGDCNSLVVRTAEMNGTDGVKGTLGIGIYCDAGVNGTYGNVELIGAWVIMASWGTLN
jgi:hypothetical protein